jgi:hypothetical protein
MLSQDLKDAAAIGPNGARRKSWQRAGSTDTNTQSLARRNGRTTEQRGFQSEVALSPLMVSGPSPSPRQSLVMPESSSVPKFFTDDELSFNPDPGNALGFGVDPGSYRGTDSMGDLDSSESLESDAIDISIPSSAYSHPVPHTDASADGDHKSPRQRRRLNNGDKDTKPTLSSSAPSVFTFQGTSTGGGATIPHTGTATFHLTDKMAAMVSDEEPKAMSELADVVGQLSLDENVGR